MKKITVLTCLLALAATSAVVAQEKSDNGINPLSLRPVHESNVMYKLTLWRRLDLNEKANQPLFASGSEITKHLIDGVKAGVLEPYDNDSLATKITLEEFTKRMTKKFADGGLSKEEIEFSIFSSPNFISLSLNNTSFSQLVLKILSSSKDS